MSNATKNKKQQQPLVRIDHADKVVLEQLSAKTGESTPRLLHRAVTQLRKQIFFEQMNSAYSQLRNSKDAWEAELEERAIFEKTSGDGLMA